MDYRDGGPRGQEVWHQVNGHRRGAASISGKDQRTRSDLKKTDILLHAGQSRRRRLGTTSLPFVPLQRTNDHFDMIMIDCPQGLFTPL